MPISAAVIENFKRQHQDLVQLVKQLDAMLVPATLPENAAAARSLLSQMAGKLQVHLAMEDRNLYPQMLQSGDGDIKTKTQDFVNEMGGIAAAFKSYSNKWHNAMIIEQDPAGFIKDTKAVFKILGERIQKEEGELYQMALRC